MKDQKERKKRQLTQMMAAVTAFLMALTFVCVTGSSDIKAESLPFTLKAPVYTALTSLNGNDSVTTMDFTYSIPAGMNTFLALSETDPDAQKKKIADCGYEDLIVRTQVDWAIDDPVNGWHYTQYWDTDGKDADGNSRLGAWDVIDFTPGNNAVADNNWILRGSKVSESDGTETDDWKGTETVPGLKDQLKEGQYSLQKNEDGETYFSIDYSSHTVYARARFDVLTGTADGYKHTFSEWSPVAGYGKDASPWKVDATNFPVPAVSDLSLSSEKEDGFPVAVVKQTVPDALSEMMVALNVNGGVVFLEAQGRVKGTQEWKVITGDREVKEGYNTISLQYLQLADEAIPDDTPVEIRFRYYYEQNDTLAKARIAEGFSEFTDIMTVNTTEIPAANGATAEDDKPITSLDKTGASEKQVEKFVTGLKNDDDPKGTVFGFLLAKQKKVTKSSVTITWQKPKKAAYYVIYGNKCGKQNLFVRLTSVKKTTYTQKKLDKGTYYKFLISAFDANGKFLGSSNVVHVVTKGGNCCNFKKITTAAKGDKVTLAKKGKIFYLKGKAEKESGKMKTKIHRKVCYESTNKKVATVSSAGKITAKKKGSCYIYVYAQNGIYKKIKVTVKS